MALLKAARVADVPTLDVVVAPGLVAVAKARSAAAVGGRFSVIGHRGKGMNALASEDPRLRDVRENTVRSFNDAGRFPVDYVEFDVQVLINWWFIHSWHGLPMQINLSHAMRRKPREREREGLPSRPAVSAQLGTRLPRQAEASGRVGLVWRGRQIHVSVTWLQAVVACSMCRVASRSLAVVAWLARANRPSSAMRMLVVSCRLLQKQRAQPWVCAPPHQPKQRRNRKTRQKAKPSEERQLTIAKNTTLLVGFHVSLPHELVPAVTFAYSSTTIIVDPWSRWFWLRVESIHRTVKSVFHCFFP